MARLERVRTKAGAEAQMGPPVALGNIGEAPANIAWMVSTAAEVVLIVGVA
jgi:hypothetical protein